MRIPRPIRLAIVLLLLPLAGTAGPPPEGPAWNTPPPGAYEIRGGGESVRIPFTIYRGDILMRAAIHGREVRLMLDNGVLWDQLLLFGGPRVDSLGLAPGDTILVGGVGDGDPVASLLARDVGVRFGDILFTGQDAIVTPGESGMAERWEGADGQISAAFFKHFRVAIDFDEGWITLSPFDDRAPAGEGAFLPMRPMPNGSYALSAEFRSEQGAIRRRDLRIDLGCSEALLLASDPRWTEAFPRRTDPLLLGYGVQGEVRGRLGRIAGVRIGPYEAENVLAGLHDSPGGGVENSKSYIGFDLLSRFNLVFDYFHAKLFLEPNARFGDPFEYDMSGIGLGRREGGAWTVARIRAGSPAEEAGIRAGDRILRIGGGRAGEYGRDELHALFREEGARLRVLLERDGEERTLSLTLRRLI